MDSVSIDEVYGALSTDGGLQVVDAMVCLISQIRATTFTKSGKLAPTKDGTSQMRDISSTLSQWKHASVKSSQDSDPTGARTPTGADTHHGQDLDTHYAQRLDAVLEQVAKDSFFMATAEEPCCLFFRDLLPSKIFLTKGDAGVWTVSRLACDDAWSVKIIVAASPPSWLWGGTLGSDKFILKKRYDQAMSKTELIAPHVVSRFETYEHHRKNPTSSIQDPDYYMKQTYGIGKWFRRLMHCQLFTPSDTEIEQFLQEWAVYAGLHELNTPEVEPQTSTKPELPNDQTLLCDTPRKTCRPCNTKSPEQSVPEQATTNTPLNSDGSTTPQQSILKQSETNTRLTRSNSGAKRSVHFDATLR